MNIQRVKLFQLLVGCMLLYCGQNLQGLPSGSKVFSDTRTTSIEKLVAGDVITGYSVADGSLHSVTVQQIHELNVDSIIEIKISKGSIFAIPEQLFYDEAKCAFIAASELTGQSVLVSRNLGKLPCFGIEKHAIKTCCYKLVLDWPHTFFGTDFEILAHNIPPFAVAAVGVPAWLVDTFAGLAVVAYVKGNVEVFTDLVSGKTKALKNIDLFTQSHGKQLPTNVKQNVSFVAQPPLIVGIRPDPTAYHEMRASPQLYSPMIVSAEMGDCGEIICTIWTLRLNRFDGKTIWYLRQPIGQAPIARTDPLIKVFLQEEDKKQLDQLRDFVKTWPAKDLAKIKSENAADIRQATLTMDYTQTPTKSFDHHPSTPVFRRGASDPTSLLRFVDKMIYGLRFTGHAIQRMVERGIPPSVVANTIDRARRGVEGTEKVLVKVDPKYIDRLQLDDKLNKIRIIIESNWHTVVSVFSNSDIGKK